jgi:predicted GNAT family N-acyltransferase
MASHLHEQWRQLSSRLGTLGQETNGGRSQQSRIVIVRTVDELMRVQAIRAMVYMADQACPYDEEFDGNDLCAMHLLGWVGSEPAACLRIRFFNNFAKIERLAVRPQFRRSSLAFRMVRTSLRIVARKGYRQAYGHAQEGLESFWMRFGAKPIGPMGAFAFSGYRYTEMMVELPPVTNPVQIGIDPMVLVRPEGAWDEPGVLESINPNALPPLNASDATPAPSLASNPWNAEIRAAWQRWATAR